MAYRQGLPQQVARQLPEFVREDYPTFVAFVEAYYEYMMTQGVDFDKFMDLDQTIDEFVEYFKKELAVNLPIVVEDERMLLQHIKDQYLSKGSEGSFKLLFRLLFAKNVELTYPGDSMLIASDGKWNQEISCFVDVDYGDPEDIVGQLVDISSGDRVLSVLVDRKEELIGEVDRVRLIGGDIYEIFLDKRFFGTLNDGDKIRYKDQFQATILPATTTLEVGQPGKDFRVGQVFELQSGGGTGALMKVTQTTAGGGIKRAEFIKFGIGYTADFAVSVLANNSVTSTQREVSASTSRLVTDNGDGTYDTAQTIGDLTKGFTEQGYINNANYVSTTYIDGTYAGDLLREFSLSSSNANTNAEDPAVINITLGALNRYPGYFETNAGFLSDSIFIQDSKYYQKFSYVLRIDERLADYGSAVKTMVHPAGMRLFGEYDITNEYDLSIALQSLVKSLGISLDDNVDIVENGITWHLQKPLSDSIDTPTDSAFTKIIYNFQETVFALTDDDYYDMVKAESDSISTDDSDWIHDTEKALSTSLATPNDNAIVKLSEKGITDTVSPTDDDTYNLAKYVEDNTVGTWSNRANIYKNSYNAQDYWIYTEEYEGGLQESTTN
jgi:hypothetical protein